jgi:hypothetical protein
MRYLATILAGLFLLAMTSCSNYGTKLDVGDEDELYYTENVTEAEAKELGDYLLDNKILFNNDGKKVSAQVDKDGETMMVKFVVQEQFHDDAEIGNQFQMIADMLSFKLYKGKPVEVHICDDKLKTVKTKKSNKFSEEDLSNPL